MLSLGLVLELELVLLFGLGLDYFMFRVETMVRV